MNSPIPAICYGSLAPSMIRHLKLSVNSGEKLRNTKAGSLDNNGEVNSIGI